MNHKKTISLSPIIKTLLPKQLYKKRFLLQDKGLNNHINIAKDARIIGNSTITIRKGHDNHITIGKGGKFNQLKLTSTAITIKSRLESTLNSRGDYWLSVIIYIFISAIIPPLLTAIFWRAIKV